MRPKVRSTTLRSFSTTLRSLQRAASCGMATSRDEVRGMDGGGAALGEEAAQMVGTVASSPTGSPGGVMAETTGAATAVSSDIAAGHQDRMRTAVLVAERVDPAGAPAAQRSHRGMPRRVPRAADGLTAGGAFPLFRAGSRTMCVHRRTLDDRDPRRVSAGDERGEECVARAREGSSGSNR
jgi:hypothetical protein